MKKRRFCLALAIVLAISSVAFTGCGDKKEKETVAGADAEFLEYLKTAEYPVETDRTLTAWSYRGGTTYGTYKADELPYLKNLEKKTGIKVDWTFANTDVKQQFNLLVASGDFPDMVSYMWGVSADFPGGPERAIADGYITPIDDLIDNYAPNFKKYLSDNEVAQRELKTDSGKYYYVPNYVTTKEANGGVSNGYVFRKDWLDELGLELPETIDDWYTALKAFKEKKGASAPFSLAYSNLGRGLTNPYDISLGLFNDEGTVRYGYSEEGYRQFLTEMNKWYEEGLLDRNIATIDSKGIDANVLNGKTGASHYWKSGLRNVNIAGKDKDPDFSLVGVKFPVKEKGDIPRFGTKDAMIYYAGFAISKNSQNKELAMKFLDYGFSTEGRELMQFGIEGETYVIEDGEYKLTDLILNNPEGYSVGEASAMYIRNTENIPLLQGYDNLRAKYEPKDAIPEVDEAIAKWKINDGSQITISHSIAPGVELTSEYAKLQSEIGTYASEMFLKFILGDTPLKEFDAYLAELNKRGLPRYLEIAQDCVDRYMDR